MIDNFLDIDGLKVHYLVYGQGPPLLFLHGHRADCYRYKKITDRLAKKFTVYIPDLPGFGQSSEFKSKHTIKNYISFLNKFISQIGVDDLILVGGSFGATLIFYYYSQAKLKIKKIVLIGPIIDNEIVKFPKIIIFLAKVFLNLTLSIHFFERIGDSLIHNDLLFDFLLKITTPKKYQTSEILNYEKHQWQLMSTKVWCEVSQSVFNLPKYIQTISEIPIIVLLSEYDKYIDIVKTEQKLKQLFINNETIILKGLTHIDPGEIPDSLLKRLSYIFDKI